MYDLSKFAIKKQIPIVFTNMIRNIEEKEVENMQSAIDKFTHIKIHLSKKNSKFQGKIYWALDQNYFSYQIHQFGLSD
jgi:DNA repair protein RAD51